MKNPILQNVKKINTGKYISNYELTYALSNGKEKIYEMVSRNTENDNLKPTLENMQKTPVATGVSLIVFDGPKHERILITKEFRMAVNNEIYGFPGGLIDKKEDIIKTAARELKEETGLDLTCVYKILPPSFSNAGITNETIYIIICYANGEIKNSNNPNEVIHAKWMTKDELNELLQKSDTLSTSRLQSFALSWCNNI